MTQISRLVAHKYHNGPKFVEAIVALRTAIMLLTSRNRLGISLSSTLKRCSWSICVDADSSMRSSGLGGGRAARSRSLYGLIIPRKCSRRCGAGRRTLGAAATSRTRKRTRTDGGHELCTLSEVAGHERRRVSIRCSATSKMEPPQSL